LMSWWQGTTEFMRILTLKIAQRFDGGDGFGSVCMRHSLSVYYTGWALPFHLVGVSGYAMFSVPSWWGFFVFSGHKALLACFSLIIGYVGVAWWLRVFGCMFFVRPLWINIIKTTVCIYRGWGMVSFSKKSIYQTILRPSPMQVS
jgi:hypothetical protein